MCETYPEHFSMTPLQEDDSAGTCADSEKHGNHVAQATLSALRLREAAVARISMPAQRKSSFSPVTAQVVRGRRKMVIVGHVN